MASPRPIGDVMAQLLARRGYAREMGSAALAEAWQQAVGAEMAAVSRPGLVKRGTLEVIVANSALMQELTFSKAEFVAKLARLAPDEKIGSLKFRVGAVE
jgi:predicted nucleic acid-binding Zn ribbon protein